VSCAAQNNFPPETDDAFGNEDLLLRPFEKNSPFLTPLIAESRQEGD
jgi:hypothetical protein